MPAPQRLSPASFVKHASDVASFYGFSPLREVERELFPKRTKGLHNFGSSLEVCASRVAALKGEPVLAYYASANPSHVPAAFPTKDSGEFGLHIVGASESLGEILLLKTVYAIMTEWGTAVARVRVNALGDRDSKLRFERELGAYLRKHAQHLDASCRKALSDRPLDTYVCTNAACRDIVSDGPRAMSFLSEKSRAHFREVLEYVESLGLPYEVDDLLVGDEREQRIVFALDLEEGDATVLGSAGGRYDEYVRRITNRKEGAGVSANIFFRKKGLSKTSFAVPQSQRRPKIYFVQLGLRAKLQGLQVVDLLREAQVPIAQSFDPRSLAPQLQSARERGVSHLLIMGQREALDGTIIVRSTTNSQQTIVPVLSLPKYLKGLKV
jgi:histidyl-tRNA synthetase